MPAYPMLHVHTPVPLRPSEQFPLPLQMVAVVDEGHREQVAPKYPAAQTLHDAVVFGAAYPVTHVHTPEPSTPSEHVPFPPQVTSVADVVLARLRGHTP